MSVATNGHSGPWTLSDVLALPEDPRNRIELVGGALVMSPSPGVPHQRASHRLAALLDAAVEAASAPVEVLEAVNVVVPDGLLIPDIAVIDDDAAADAGLTVDAHDVLVVVEIASPSTRVTDRKMKPALYAAAGIPYYWRLELEPAPRLYLGRLERGSYTDRVVQTGETTALTEPFTFDIDPARLTRR
ncbi:Uma2 family endonuclease [Streptomyces jumonjinensis]|uniref:Uma2 family endonuclease n=1 Tax=Streptomyces jumonjinensis TaxID=1945 RepID=A0A646KKF3_STRJU|nr:Uma2 family endonuclease [Streptomyces jumonjinensis]MQT02774.1 Uma2 family endonuclease [Streptomyces jumonjinensis]